MTPEEEHNYNKSHAIGHISYEAVCKDDFIIQMRTWIEGWLDIAYEAGFNNAKKGEL